jgi:hypothetical protein
MRRLLVTTGWILLSALALGGVSGIATCGSDVREDGPAYENRDEVTTDEMIDDVARDEDL